MALGLVLFAFGCGDAKFVAPTPPAEAFPLLAMNPDRLWILLWARDDMQPRCVEFYANPEDARYAELKGRCEQWEINATQMLRANGVSDAQREDLRGADFWKWYGNKAREIARCSEDALKSPENATGAGRALRLSCDPYRRLTRLEERTVEDAGIRLP